MNRSIIFAAVMVSVAILLNGYLGRVAQHPPTKHSSEAQPVAREKSVAILPIDDLGSSADSNELAINIQRDLISRLSSNREIRVLGESEVAGYIHVSRNMREIGRKHHVAYVLEGSVVRVSDRIRVFVSLIDAQNDRHVWAEDYKRDVAELSALQTEIAGRIMALLGENER